LQVQNELLYYENQGLRAALVTKRKNSKKSKPLDLQQCQEYHGGAVFWSPRKVRDARARESVKQREDEAEKLREAETKELKAAASLYRRNMAEEARALREQAKEQRKRDAEAKAKEREAARAQNQQEKEAATTKKLAEQANKATRTASQSRVKKSHSQRGAVGGAVGGASGAPTSTQDDHAGTANQPPPEI
jgi:membrane protein involved in colicin uptake